MSSPSLVISSSKVARMETAVTSSSKRHSTMIIGFLRASMAFTYHRFFTSKTFSNLIFRLGLVILTFCLQRQRRPDREDGAESSSDDTVLIMDGSCPMLVPIHVVTSMIKSRIPVVEFGEYVERCRRRRGLNNKGGEEGEDPSSCCAVCLGTIEWGHVIREPSNCDHVFHRECLDRWIGEHRVTCPLCRCIMLPARRNITFC